MARRRRAPRPVARIGPAAAEGATGAVAVKIVDAFDPIINWLLAPLRRFVTWFYNRYLADKQMAPKPLLKPLRPVPTEMVLYVPGL